MQKKQKIKPENQKLENYLEVPLRSPSRSSFVLNSRTVALHFFIVFYAFYLRAGEGVVRRCDQCSGNSVQYSVSSVQCSVISDQ